MILICACAAAARLGLQLAELTAPAGAAAEAPVGVTADPSASLIALSEADWPGLWLHLLAARELRMATRRQAGNEMKCE